MSRRVVSILLSAAALLYGQNPGRAGRPAAGQEPREESRSGVDRRAAPLPRGEGETGESLPFSTYQVGPEDLLMVTVLEAPEFSRQLRVSGAGTIRVPLVKNPIVASGRTSAQLENEIARALVEGGLLREPAVSVTVLEFHSKPVSVSGAVFRPVVFQATRPLTVVEALTRAGGVTDQAGVEVMISIPAREEQPARVQRLPLRQLLQTPASEHDLLLRGGEEIRVASAGRVYVLGAVQRPGMIPVTGEEPLTVLRALAITGGTTPTAASRLLLLRDSQAPGPKKEVALNVKKLVKRETPDMPLSPNDVIFVPDSTLKKFRETGLTTAVSSFIYTTAGVLIWR